MLDFLTLQTASANPTAITVIYAMLLSFVLSSMVAITYQITFQGLSYSRNYVQALVLSSVVAAMVMQAIGDSLARGLAMIGALAIIRFRTAFRDPKDIIFMFAALASGISCGVFGFSAAVIGIVTFCIIAFVLYYSPLGTTRTFDGMLRFNIDNKAEIRSQFEKILQDSCVHFALVSLREVAQAQRIEYAYHVKLKKNVAHGEMVEKMKSLPSVKGINLMMQDATVEL